MITVDLLPNERILSDKFGVSRSTLRQALNMVAKNCYIIIARGKHTRIRLGIGKHVI